MKELVHRFKSLVKNDLKRFSDLPMGAIGRLSGAVFGSWMNDRAIVYRRKYGIPAEWGTQSMCRPWFLEILERNLVLGGFYQGPCFWRVALYGEFPTDAQGEDVVAGVRTPRPVAQLKKVLPKPFKELLAVQKKLEKHFKDMQDFEFTIEEESLHAQTRNGKRTGLAAVRIAVEMAGID